MDKLYTHNIASEIACLLNDFLEQYQISIPSADPVEEKDRNDSNPDGIALYGSEYSEITDRIEEYLIDTCQKHNLPYEPYVYQ